jgi:hypothetical protein
VFNPKSHNYFPWLDSLWYMRQPGEGKIGKNEDDSSVCVSVGCGWGGVCVCVEVGVCASVRPNIARSMH